MAPTVVPAGEWRRQTWRPVPRINPTLEWWVHHGAAGTPDLATLRSYERYHVSTLGWRAPGYNWAITGDGTVYELRGWFAEGAHTSGRNRVSHAVLLVGDWTRGRVPDAMVESLAWLTREGARVGALVRPQISGGHRDAPGQSTTCPGAAGMDAIDRARRLLAQPAPAPDRRPSSGGLLEEIAAMTDKDREKLLADIARRVWDHQMGRTGQTHSAVLQEARNGVQLLRERRATDQTVRALAAEVVAQIRRDAGRPADPASDRVWVDRLAAGTHTIADARRALTP